MATALTLLVLVVLVAAPVAILMVLATRCVSARPLSKPAHQHPVRYHYGGQQIR